MQSQVELLEGMPTFSHDRANHDVHPYWADHFLVTIELLHLWLVLLKVYFWVNHLQIGNQFAHFSRMEVPVKATRPFEFCIFEEEVDFQEDLTQLKNFPKLTSQHFA